MCCFEYSAARIARDAGKIVMIDPSGGPSIFVGSKIDGTDIDKVSSIYFDDNLGFIIETAI